MADELTHRTHISAYGGRRVLLALRYNCRHGVLAPRACAFCVTVRKFKLVSWKMCTEGCETCWWPAKETGRCFAWLRLTSTSYVLCVISSTECMVHACQIANVYEYQTNYIDCVGRCLLIPVLKWDIAKWCSKIGAISNEFFI